MHRDALALETLQLTSLSMLTFLKRVVPRVCELVNSLQFLSFHCDGGFNIGLIWSWLAIDIGLLGAYGEAKVITYSGELAHDHLHLCFRACIKSAVISKQEVSQYSLFNLDVGLKSAQVEELSICFVLMWTPWSLFQKASVSMAENTMLKRVDASTQPCLT